MPKLTFIFPDRTEIRYALHLDRAHTTIGRAADSKIALEHSSVSSHHACIDRITGGFMLIDMHSTNGIRENNVKQTMTPLKPGRVYKIGDVVMECHFSPDELARFAKETNDLTFVPSDSDLLN